MPRLLLLFVATVEFGLAACSGSPRGTGSVLYDPHALPSGPLGESIAYGHDIVVETESLMKDAETADGCVFRLFDLLCLGLL